MKWGMVAMSPERLLTHFEQISEAPDAVPRLRRFILDLAVRGKLVEQDPADEPAAELLKRIAAEKKRLAKAGEIRKEKILPPIDEEGSSFNLPASWVWAPIRKITADRGQKIPDREFSYVDVSAIDKERGKIAEPQVLTPDAAPSRARKIVQKGDVIYSCVRPYLLNIAVVEEEFDPEPIVSTAFAVLNGLGFVVPRYLWIVLRSPYFVGCVEEKMRGQAYPAINDGDFAPLPVPLPSQAEQHRIVAKVDELMALCDELEAAQVKRERRRDRLVAATLHGLKNGGSCTESGDSLSFAESARFYFDHLPRLTTRPDHIQQLRQTILNLAVSGKLVPQDPKGKPAASGDSCPEWLPFSWKYERLANFLSDETRNGYSRRPDDASDGVPILRISAGTKRRDGVVAEEEHKLIGGIDSKTRLQYGLNSGDLLACRFNGNKSFVGRLTIFNDYLGIKPIYPDKLIRVRLSPRLAVPAFIRLAGDSDIVRNDVVTACATTVGNWGISASNLKEICFPLPPLAEQHRIVAKVDELMSLCDELETQLTTTATARRQLLETTLNEALYCNP